MATHLCLDAIQKHYFNAPRCKACKTCVCAKSKFQKMDTFDKSCTIMLLVIGIIACIVWYRYGKRIMYWAIARMKGDLERSCVFSNCVSINSKTKMEEAQYKHVLFCKTSLFRYGSGGRTIGCAV